VTPELLVADGVWKRYGDRDALRDVRFSIRSGEAVGYLGPNGAGKTTTLKLLAGISRPTRGSVRVQGEDPSRDRQRALRRVGALVETPGVPAYVTGADLLEYVARVKGIASADCPSAIGRAANAMGVADALDRPFGSLSTGLARRVLLGAALVGDPEVLLLDEPTLGLDPAARDDLRTVLRGLARNGLTILLSTHLLEDVEAVCERVLFLRNGTLVGDEPVRTDGSGKAGAATRRLVLRFGSDVDEVAVRRATGSGFDISMAGAREASIGFAGGDPAQQDLVGRVVREGLPLLAASVPESDLARRYLQLVGREEAT